MVGGHICLVVHPDLGGSGRKPFEAEFLPGRLIAAGPVTYSSGGAVANTGLALHRLGISTCLVGKVGDDLFGHALHQIVTAYGENLTENLQVDTSANTS